MISAVTGTTVAQNVPVTIPLARANTISTVYDFPGTQIERQKYPKESSHEDGDVDAFEDI
jgi:hypothetical protein